MSNPEQQAVRIEKGGSDTEKVHELSPESLEPVTIASNENETVQLREVRERLGQQKENVVILEDAKQEKLKSSPEAGKGQVSKLRSGIHTVGRIGGTTLLWGGGLIGGASALTIGGGATMGAMGVPAGYAVANEGINFLAASAKGFGLFGFIIGFPFILDKVLQFTEKVSTGAAPKAGKSSGGGGGGGGAHH